MPLGKEYALGDFVDGDKVMFKMAHVDDYGTWWTVVRKYKDSLQLQTDFGGIPKDDRFIEPKYVIMRERPQ